LTAGQQTLSVYAHTPGNGWWYEQVPINVTSAPVAASAPASGSGGLPVVVIETPKDSETVLTKSDYTIIGYALDPSAAQNQGTGIDTVAVYLGDRDNGGTFLGNADLGGSDSTAEAQYGSQFASAGWRLTFKPTNFHANTYLLYAYAHSAITGKEDNAVRYFAIREHS
jgi:hypothetical protein